MELVERLHLKKSVLQNPKGFNKINKISVLYL